jgi:hypothetical protein
MCGRYTIAKEEEMLAVRFHIEVPPGSMLHPSYNAAPSQDLPAILNTEPCAISLPFWGFVPEWADGKKGIKAVINARAESIAPILIVWVGVGIELKIAMATIGTLFVALVQAYEGARSVDLDQIRLLRIFGASKTQIFRKVIVTSSLTWVFASLKLNTGFALLGAFIGEFISSEYGLGHLILRAGSLYNIPLVFAGSLVIIILAFAFNWIVEWIERRRFIVIEFISMPRIVFRRNVRRQLSEIEISPR